MARGPVWLSGPRFLTLNAEERGFFSPPVSLACAGYGNGELVFPWITLCAEPPRRGPIPYNQASWANTDEYSAFTG